MLRKTVEKVRMLDQGLESNPFVVLNAGSSVCGSDFFIERKSLSFNAAEFVLSGSGFLETGGKVYNIKENDVFFLKHSQAHRYYAAEGEPWKKIFVSFYGKAADSLTDCYLSDKSPVINCAALREIFINILNTAFSQNSAEYIQYQCISLIFDIFNTIQIKNTNRDLAGRVKELIDGSLQSEFSLEKLCERLNYSKNHIVNVFSEKYGVTPYHYYLESKITLTKKYLSFTSLSAAEIARLFGYSDAAYFSYSFKKATGMTPTEYRKSNAL